jgi:hypothetical protein
VLNLPVIFVDVICVWQMPFASYVFRVSCRHGKLKGMSDKVIPRQFVESTWPSVQKLSLQWTCWLSGQFKQRTRTAEVGGSSWLAPATLHCSGSRGWLGRRREQATGWTTPGRGSDLTFFSSPPPPHRFWGSHILLSSGYRRRAWRWPSTSI